MTAGQTAARSPALAIQLLGLDFQNPIVLAAGTAAYGRELGRCTAEFDGLWALTKRSVSQAARHGVPGTGSMVTKLAY